MFPHAGGILPPVRSASAFNLCSAAVSESAQREIKTHHIAVDPGAQHGAKRKRAAAADCALPVQGF